MSKLTDRSTGRTTPLPRKESSYKAMSPDEIKQRCKMVNDESLPCNDNSARAYRYSESNDTLQPISEDFFD